MKELITTALSLLTLVATLALAELGLLPTMSLTQWDTVATVFWSMVPFMLVLLLSVAVRLLYNLGPALIAIWPTVKAELETRSAMNDALMWQARHAAKAQRTGKN